jgi:hypothetical protein
MKLMLLPLQFTILEFRSTHWFLPLFSIIPLLRLEKNELLTPKGPKTIFKPFLKFGQAIVKAIFIKNPWLKLWTCGLVLASRHTNFYKIPIFGLVLMSQNTFFPSTWVAKKLFIIKFF